MTNLYIITIANDNRKDLADLYSSFNSFSKFSVKLNINCILVNNNPYYEYNNLLEVYPFVKLIERFGKYGFASNNNYAIDQLGLKDDDWIAFINPDVVFTSVFFRNLNKWVGADKGYNKIITPVTLKWHKGKDTQGVISVQESTRDFITWKYMLARLFHDELSLAFYYNKYYPLSCEVDWTFGAAMIMCYSVYRKVGGFDNRFFLYFEDQDFCLRAKRKGYSTIRTGELQIYHKLSQAFKHDWRRKCNYFASLFKYIIKHFWSL